jgi:hypothetical protein
MSEPEVRLVTTRFSDIPGPILMAPLPVVGIDMLGGVVDTNNYAEAEIFWAAAPGLREGQLSINRRGPVESVGYPGKNFPTYCSFIGVDRRHGGDPREKISSDWRAFLSLFATLEAIAGQLLSEPAALEYGISKISHIDRCNHGGWKVLKRQFPLGNYRPIPLEQTGFPLNPKYIGHCVIGEYPKQDPEINFMAIRPLVDFFVDWELNRIARETR